MDIPILKDLLVIFGLSIAVLLVCHRVKIPTIVGFLITGIISGPHGLKLVKSVEEVHLLSHIGIIVLLFIIGLEFSIRRIIEYKRFFFIAGPIQVGLTILGGILAGQLTGRPFGESIFLGFLLSLSSTAIVLRTLQERAETNTLYGRFILGVLIFQDIIVVPMMLAVPLLTGAHEEFSLSLLFPVFKGLAVLAFVFFGSLKAVPFVLYYVAKTKSRELFLMSILTLCFGVAWVTSQVGLSLALGAFLAGIIISDSDYSAQVIGDMVPLQDIFTSLFFVSIGMLMDTDFLLEYPTQICLATLAVLALKATVVFGASILLNFTVRLATLSGLALSQVGEFSFILATVGKEQGLANEFLYSFFLAVAIISMALTPVLIALAPRIASIISYRFFPKRDEEDLITSKSLPDTKQSRVLIIGFGFSGKNLAKSLKEAAIPYTVIEMNPQTVKEEKAKGEPITYGDATSTLVLKHCNIDKMAALAVVINDPQAALRVVKQAKRLNPNLYIVTRVRFLEEVQSMFQAGADDVIPDELGSTVEIFTHVLEKCQVSRKNIAQLVRALRDEGYETIKPHYTETVTFSDLDDYINDVGIKTVKIGQESPFADKTVAEIALRKNYGITIIIIKRDQESIFNIEPHTKLLSDDEIVVIGTKDKLENIGNIL